MANGTYLKEDNRLCERSEAIQCLYLANTRAAGLLRGARKDGSGFS